MFARIAVVAASTALALPMLAGAATAGPQISDGAGQPNENANCLAQERATRNSAGGDRDHGRFGPAQSAYVHTLNESGTNFGAFLQDWKADC